jgi:hypothetical protein
MRPGRRQLWGISGDRWGPVRHQNQEVKSGRASGARSGLEVFSDAFRPQRKLLVGGDGIALESFLSRTVEFWTKQTTKA